jgi:hypothetical protein
MFNANYCFTIVDVVLPQNINNWVAAGVTVIVKLLVVYQILPISHH